MKKSLEWWKWGVFPRVVLGTFHPLLDSVPTLACDGFCGRDVEMFCNGKPPPWKINGVADNIIVALHWTEMLTKNGPTACDQFRQRTSCDSADTRWRRVLRPQCNRTTILAGSYGWCLSRVFTCAALRSVAGESSCCWGLGMINVRRQRTVNQNVSETCIPPTDAQGFSGEYLLGSRVICQYTEGF